MVRNLTAVCMMYAKGEITLEEVERLLDGKNYKPDYNIMRAHPFGLTLLNVFMREGCLEKEPFFLEEEDFMRGQKKKLKAQGLEYKHPYEVNDTEDECLGSLFDDEDEI